MKVYILEKIVEVLTEEIIQGEIQLEEQEEFISALQSEVETLEEDKASLKQLNSTLQNRCQEYIEMLGGDQIPDDDAV